MQESLLKADLDRMRCSRPGCSEPHDDLYFHSTCHISAPTWVSYKEGIVTITCAFCSKPVARIKVADG